MRDESKQSYSSLILHPVSVVTTKTNAFALLALIQNRRRGGVLTKTKPRAEGKAALVYNCHLRRGESQNQIVTQSLLRSSKKFKPIETGKISIGLMCKAK